MPGPVSDSYDPEYSTSSNREDVAEAIGAVKHRLTGILGKKLRNIVEVVQEEETMNSKVFHLEFSEQELRVIRFALNKCLDECF